MKAYLGGRGLVEAYLNSSLTSPLDGGEWSGLWPAHFILGERACHFLLIRRVDEPLIAQPVVLVTTLALYPSCRQNYILHQ